MQGTDENTPGVMRIAGEHAIGKHNYIIDNVDVR